MLRPTRSRWASWVRLSVLSAWSTAPPRLKETPGRTTGSFSVGPIKERKGTSGMTTATPPPPQAASPANRMMPNAAARTRVRTAVASSPEATVLDRNRANQLALAAEAAQHAGAAAAQAVNAADLLRVRTVEAPGPGAGKGAVRRADIAGELAGARCVAPVAAQVEVGVRGPRVGAHVGQQGAAGRELDIAILEVGEGVHLRVGGIAVPGAVVVEAGRVALEARVGQSGRQRARRRDGAGRHGAGLEGAGADILEPHAERLVVPVEVRRVDGDGERFGVGPPAGAGAEAADLVAAEGDAGLRRAQPEAGELAGGIVGERGAAVVPVDGVELHRGAGSARGLRHARHDHRLVRRDRGEGREGNVRDAGATAAATTAGAADAGAQRAHQENGKGRNSKVHRHGDLLL